MVRQTLIYGGDLRCELTHGPSGATLLTDAPVDNRGQGREFSPTDLAATSMLSCMVTILAMQAEDMGLDMEGLTAEVTKEMAASPRRIKRLAAVIRVPGDLSERQRDALRKAAEGCPVKHSLHPEVIVDLTFEWGASTVSEAEA